VTAGRPTVEDTTTLVRFDGRRLLDERGVLLAEFADDGRWYTGDGVPCSGLALPAIRVTPEVSSHDREAAQRAADKVWMDAAHEVLRRLAETHETFTGDEVWAALQMPPREGRMIGNALTRAHNAGFIEPTDKHQPSTRTANHSRPVRVWRSLLYKQQSLL
jgi:hypothetical protein